MDYFTDLKRAFSEQIGRAGYGGEKVEVSVRALSSTEAIGTPEHQDYPIIKGREKMMAAEFMGCQGQAFTDHYGTFSGTLSQVAGMELEDNFERAVFLASLNAVWRALDLVEGTVHCKDEQPPLCAAKLADMIHERFGNPRIGLVGLQPRMVEALGKRFELMVSDLDEENIGKKKFGVEVLGPDRTHEMLSWCEVALITGTTLSNDTLARLVVDKPTIYYGVTVAGPAAVLKLERFCPYCT